MCMQLTDRSGQNQTGHVKGHGSSSQQIHVYMFCCSYRLLNQQYSGTRIQQIWMYTIGIWLWVTVSVIGRCRNSKVIPRCMCYILHTITIIYTSCTHIDTSIHVCWWLRSTSKYTDITRFILASPKGNLWGYSPEACALHDPWPWLLLHHPHAHTLKHLTPAKYVIRITYTLSKDSYFTSTKWPLMMGGRWVWLRLS